MVEPKLASGEAEGSKLGLADGDGDPLFAVNSEKALEARRDNMRTTVKVALLVLSLIFLNFFLSCPTPMMNKFLFLLVRTSSFFL